jgi:hypothetical protein
MTNSPHRKRVTRTTPQQLYQRYGAKPWDTLPEATREHYRGLVAAGMDGRGAPLTESTCDTDGY